MPLPPDSSGKLFRPRSSSSALQPHRRGLNLVEVETDVGIEVEHQPVGIFDLVDLAAPAVELDRPHLHAGEQALDVVEVEIVLDRLRRSPRSGYASRAGRTCPCRASGKNIRRCGRRAADQGHRAIRGIDHDQRLDRRVIVGKVFLGSPSSGKITRSGLLISIPKSSAVALRFFPSSLRPSDAFRCSRHFPHNLRRRLVLAQCDEAWMTKDSVVSELGEGDFGDELGLDPVSALAIRARHLDRRLVDRQAAPSAPSARPSARH